MPMLCIGMQCVTLYILLRRQCGAGVTRSVTNGIPTRSVRNDSSVTIVPTLRVEREE